MTHALWKAAMSEVLGDDPEVRRRYNRALDACQDFAQACPDALAGDNTISHLKAKSEAIEAAWMRMVDHKRVAGGTD